MDQAIKRCFEKSLTQGQSVADALHKKGLIDPRFRVGREQAGGNQTGWIEIARAKGAAITAFDPHEAAGSKRLQRGRHFDFVREHPWGTGARTPSLLGL